MKNKIMRLVYEDVVKSIQEDPKTQLSEICDFWHCSPTTLNKYLKEISGLTFLQLKKVLLRKKAI
jgi:methylphosphotriester-DNA--protein-cysteine methyltransferase